jgi:hypothetical protein
VQTRAAIVYLQSDSRGCRETLKTRCELQVGFTQALGLQQRWLYQKILDLLKIPTPAYRWHKRQLNDDASDLAASSSDLFETA